jgi:hypothetical protein
MGGVKNVVEKEKEGKKGPGNTGQGGEGGACNQGLPWALFGPGKHDCCVVLMQGVWVLCN